jgi:hypothetical protein
LIPRIPGMSQVLLEEKVVPNQAIILS